MGVIKDLFKLRNVITGLKALVVQSIFALLGWLLWVIAGSIGFANLSDASGVSVAVFWVFLFVAVVFSVFGWGFLAYNFWGWK